jgi:hypothetical protein
MSTPLNKTFFRPKGETNMIIQHVHSAQKNVQNSALGDPPYGDIGFDIELVVEFAM